MIFTSTYSQMTKAHADDAGYDLFADRQSYPDGTIYWEPWEVASITTTLRVAIPRGYVGRVSERSGFPSRGMALAIRGGVIDSGYHGEVIIFAQNVSPNPMSIPVEKAIAQLVVHPIYGGRILRMPRWEFNARVEASARGEDGFGSSDHGEDLS